MKKLNILAKKVNASEQLRRSQTRFDLLIAYMCDEFLEIDISTGDCVVISPSQKLRTKTKYKKRILWTVENLIVEEEREAFLAEFELKNLLRSLRRNNGVYKVIYTQLHEDGRHYLRIINSLIRDSLDPNDEYIISFSQDITELKRGEEQNRQLIDLSRYETLTELYTRNCAEKMINEYLFNASSQGVGTLLMIDIDYFKKVNDCYGHSAGDYVLKFLSKAMRGVFRSDDILCRWGGDEFLVFMKNITDEMVVESRVERLRIKMMSCEINGQDIPVTISAGIAISYGGVALSEMFQKADEMLYKAKTGGRNNFAMCKAE